MCCCRFRTPVVAMPEVSTARVEADRGVCKGYGNCAIEDPEHFDVDDEGLVVVLEQPRNPSDVAKVNEAARACPVAAITVKT